MNDAGLNLEKLDITGEITLNVKHSAVSEYTSLASDEVKDIFLASHLEISWIYSALQYKYSILYGNGIKIYYITELYRFWFLLVFFKYYMELAVEYMLD